MTSKDIGALLVTGTHPVELVEALRIGDAEEPRTRRVVKVMDAHRLGELAVLGVGVLVNRNGDAPIEEEFFVEERIDEEDRERP